MASELKVLCNHIYEYQKGVRPLILFTFNRRFIQQALQRLQRQEIPFLLRPAGKDSVNLFFGRPECLDAVRLIAGKPLNKLSPEEDFMLGALLGYDIRVQCERFCKRKGCTV